MRAAPLVLLAALALASMTPAGPALAGDAGADAGTGGGGAGGSGTGGIEVQPSATSDNYGCSAARPKGAESGIAALLILGVLGAAAGVRGRRRRLSPR